MIATALRGAGGEQPGEVAGRGVVGSLSVALRDRVRRAVGALRTRRARGRGPRLSVVVPVYNVEGYLGEALDSLLGQTFDDLEIVVVDDGSTDGSRAIIDDYVDRCPNVRLVASENRGLGAARNLGIRHCRGELLTFADSDDIVPPRAYAVMVATLDQTGSDFVVGAAQRFRGDRHLPLTRRQAELHRERALAVTVDDRPDMLGDVFAWNKVFRRAFWDHAGLVFPEGVRYEDQPTTTRAFLMARSFDVLRAPVYLWRLRDDRTSITQRRHEVDDLRDRLATKRVSLDLVRRMGSPRVVQQFYDDVLSMDLPRYFREIPACDDAYWNMLSTGIDELWADGPSFATATLPVHHRVVAWLVMADRREDAVRVVEFAEAHLPELPVTRREGGERVAMLPFWDDPAAGVPPDLFRLEEGERAGHERHRRSELEPADEAGTR
jgi:glycosyltransferase involved in cell wall biosynthesis